MDKSFSKTISIKDKSFWSNIWFYYKKHILIGSALALFIAWGVASCINQIYPDFQIMYIGKYGVEDSESAQKYLSEFVTDVNGDGKVVPRVINMAIGDGTNHQATQAYISKTDVEIQMGESSVFIMNSAYIDRYSQLECLVYLDDLADKYNIPQSRRVIEYVSGKTVGIDISGTPLCEGLGCTQDGEQALYLMMNRPTDKVLENATKAAVFEETQRVTEILIQRAFGE